MDRDQGQVTQSMEWQGWYTPCREKDKGFRAGPYSMGRRVECPCPRQKLTAKLVWEDLNQKAVVSACGVSETIPTK